MRIRFQTATAAAAACALGVLGGAALAQQQPEQIVTPPKQVYWMSVTTNAGLGGMTGADPMAMMTGGAGGSNATMLLQLGSADAPSRGAPQANHTVPQAARIGPQLPLRTPQRAAAPRDDDADMPPEFRQPRGRLLLFFGCGERAKVGQPVVFDFARLAGGQLPRGLESRVRAARVPAFNPTAWRTFGEWPHADAASPGLFGGGGQTTLPAGASLLGEHAVRGNYTPDIRFTLTPGHDVMAPVSFTTNEKTSTGAVNLVWRAIPTATAYGAMVFGAGQREGDMVFWSASEVSTWDHSADFIPPGEAARLVRERVLLSPSTTQCTVPREVVAAIKAQEGQGGGMLMFNAYGPEQNIVYPPRPADRSIPWTQQWFVKARFQSSSMEMLGQSFNAMMRQAGGREAQGMTREERCAMRAQQREAEQANIGTAIGGATGIPGADMVLGGLFGGGQKKQEPPADPECPPAR